MHEKAKICLNFPLFCLPFLNLSFKQRGAGSCATEETAPKRRRATSSSNLIGGTRMNELVIGKSPPCTNKCSEALKSSAVKFQAEAPSKRVPFDNWNDVKVKSVVPCLKEY